MKFCYNTKFTLPKQSQRSRSVLQDGSRSLGLFWKEKAPSYNRRNMVIRVLPFLNNPKLLDPSYKMDLGFWDCFGRKKLCLITKEIRYPVPIKEDKLDSLTLNQECLKASVVGPRLFFCHTYDLLAALNLIIQQSNCLLMTS